MGSLYQKLKQYQTTDVYPFHMPGHKRNRELMEEIYEEDFGSPFSVDITEIDGFDDLHHAEGILKDGMDQMAGAVGACKSYFVVNGSTGGILAAMYAACPRGSRVIVARNCHRSVAHGLQLLGLIPYYIYPQTEYKLGISLGIRREEIEDIIDKCGDISAVIVTSPTYEGIVSDIGSLAEAAHRHGAVLIVDEAHGAHLCFGEKAGLPVSAVKEGADAVIQSLHKTLPALTQSAALHVCSERIDSKRLEMGLRIFETSSPSYVMMAAMDACMRFMAVQGKERLAVLCGWLDEFYRKSEQWDELVFLTGDVVSGWGCRGFDRTKIVFAAKHLSYSGKLLHQWLVDEYRLQPEMSTPEYVVLMSTVGDTYEGFERLTQAMEKINLRLKDMRKRQQDAGVRNDCRGFVPKADVVMAPGDACAYERVCVGTAEAKGCISAEIAYIYPPGIPFLMPGERIGEEHVHLMAFYQKYGCEIHGLEDEAAEKIWVLKGI